MTGAMPKGGPEAPKGATAADNAHPLDGTRDRARRLVARRRLGLDAKAADSAPGAGTSPTGGRARECQRHARPPGGRARSRLPRSTRWAVRLSLGPMTAPPKSTAPMHPVPLVKVAVVVAQFTEALLATQILPCDARC